MHFKQKEVIDYINFISERIVQLEKENVMMKKWIKQGDRHLTPIEEKIISEWIFKNL